MSKKDVSSFYDEGSESSNSDKSAIGDFSYMRSDSDDAVAGTDNDVGLNEEGSEFGVGVGQNEDLSSQNQSPYFSEDDFSNETEPASPGMFSFSGRARRREFWWMVVCNLAITFIVGGILFAVFYNVFLGVVSDFENYGVEYGLKELQNAVEYFFREKMDLAIVFLGVYFAIGLFFFIWNLAVTVRRFHDLGWSGAMAIVLYLVNFIPAGGQIVYLVLLIFLAFAGGQPFTNKYGPDPNGRNFQNEPSRGGQYARPEDARQPQPSKSDKLRELKKLLDEGILTQEEFSAQKALVLLGRD